MEEPELVESKREPLPVYLISTNKFLLLNLLTLNLYSVWWMYKAWRIFNHKENTDLMPAARAIFDLIFTISLFKRIRNFAQEFSYQKDFSPVALFLGIFIARIGSLPGIRDTFFLLTLLAGVFFVTPNEALNFALTNSKDFIAEEESGFNSKQILLIILGILSWLLLLTMLLNGVKID